MPHDNTRSLWELTAASGLSSNRFIADRASRITMTELVKPNAGREGRELLAGRSVLISCDRQLPAVLAVLSLDGLARRIVLCPPDFPATFLPDVMAQAEVDLIIGDGSGPAARFNCRVPTVEPAFAETTGRSHDTEWLLFTSGTTGQPKLVVHTLGSLAGPLNQGPVVTESSIWGTFYDIRRYGGLTILFRALLGGASMVLSQSDETIQDFLTRAGQAGVTHMTGTPSHWRQALMSEASELIDPGYVRLSGEVADQAILDNLRAAFPKAEIAHAFASTEAGFAFDVRDGKAGFPAHLVNQIGGKADLRVKDGSLHVRSNRAASGYVTATHLLKDQEGFIDTGDMVERQGDRYYFLGRRDGIINVGGQKVHPEEVEALINMHPSVRMVRVRSRPNPIVGAIVVADVVIQPDCVRPFDAIRNEIQTACREALPAHKVPAIVRQVQELSLAGSGKLVRRDA